MAENVVINIEANTQGLQQTIDLMVKLGLVTEENAKKFNSVTDAQFKNLENNVDRTTKKIEGFGKSVNEITAQNKIGKFLDGEREAIKTGNAIRTLSQELKEAQNEASKLAKVYGLDDKRSKEAIARVSDLKQQIGDLNKQIAAVSPEGKFKAIANLGASLSGIFQVATGALQAFGAESETATKLAQQFQGAINIVSGLSQLEQLSGDLKIVANSLGLTKQVAVATATAMEGEAVATEAAAAASVEFTTALTATGWGAILVGIAAIAAAMYAFASNTEDAKNKVNDLKNEIAGTQVEFDGQLKSLENQQKVSQDNYDTQIKIAQLQGASAKEIGDLQRQKIEDERKYINLKLKFNNEALKADQEAYDKVINLNDEESIQLADELSKRIQSRKDYSKQLEVDGKLLVNKNKVNEVQITKDIKDENQKRREENAKTLEERKKALGVDANKAEFDRASSLIEQYYTEQELLIKKSGKTKEEIDNDVTDNNIMRLQEQIDAAKKNYQDYTKLEIQLQDLINKRTEGKAVTITETPLPTTSEMPQSIKDNIKKADDLKKSLKSTLETELFKGATDTMNAYFDQWVDRITEVDKIQKESLDQQSQDLQDSYNNKLIGKIEFDAKTQALDEKKMALEKKTKRDEDRANREKALFKVLIDTASTIMKTAAEVGLVGLPPLLPLILGISGAQAAAIMAAPMPKYKKGTLSVPGIGSDDTQPALLTPGEAVIPKDTNAQYKDAISAIYYRKIKADDINAFVRMKLKGDYSSGGSQGPLTAKMETSDLYALGRMMNKNNGVYIKNVGELASVFASMHNPRR